MLYLDDRITRHPKILRAGQILGGSDGAARAFAMFIDAIAYSRQYLLDGFVPDQFVAGSPLMRRPAEVALALAAVDLFHREPERGGFTIHDFHKWNKSAAEVRKRRELWRLQKQSQRRDNGGRFGGER